MKTLGRMMTHFRLVSRMARTLGARPEVAMQAGALSQAEWADMVQTCRRCGHGDACAQWLDTRTHAERAPAHCLNRARLERLQARMSRMQEA